ncbi:transposase [Nonomuraea sp. NPDC050691]|uniref:transposase n=1 Tax=Nonomuraea sp. NPDC050691 TaxID=3155661 RepID=UPI0033F6FEEB
MTYPAGHQVPLSAPSGRNQQRKAFFTSQCAGCPLRPRCTTAKAGRILTSARPSLSREQASAAGPLTRF